MSHISYLSARKRLDHHILFKDSLQFPTLHIMNHFLVVCAFRSCWEFFGQILVICCFGRTICAVYFISRFCFGFVFLRMSIRTFFCPLCSYHLNYFYIIWFVKICRTWNILICITLKICFVDQLRSDSFEFILILFGQAIHFFVLKCCWVCILSGYWMLIMSNAHDRIVSLKARI